MGTEYYIACKDCKVTRDLHKFYIECWPCENREQAIAMSNDLSNSRHFTFGAALLIGFLHKHYGHNVVFFSEHHENYDLMCPYEWDEEPSDFRMDLDFWAGP